MQTLDWLMLVVAIASIVTTGWIHYKRSEINAKTKDAEQKTGHLKLVIAALVAEHREVSDTLGKFQENFNNSKRKQYTERLPNIKDKSHK